MLINLKGIIFSSTQFFQLLTKFHITESIKFFLHYKLNLYFLTILQIVTLKDNCYLIHIVPEIVLFLISFFLEIFWKLIKWKNFFCLFTFFLVIVRKILFFYYKKLGFGIKHEHLWWLSKIMEKTFKLLFFRNSKSFHHIL